jgi:hypothetical protein
MQEAQGGPPREDEVVEADGPERHVRVLTPEPLAQHRIEPLERVHGDQEDRESGAADELEEVRGVDRNGFAHGDASIPVNGRSKRCG